MTDQSLQDLWQQAWDALAARRDARLWSLATVDQAGQPTVRTVVLRDADRDAGTVTFHTDLRSAKVGQLRTQPAVGLMCWIAPLDLQFRGQATARIAAGDAVMDEWAKVPDPSREAYGTTPAPATPIAGPLAYDKPADPDSFAVLTCRLDGVDLTSLAQPHRRAQYARMRDWGGQWVAP